MEKNGAYDFSNYKNAENKQNGINEYNKDEKKFTDMLVKTVAKKIEKCKNKKK